MNALASQCSSGCESGWTLYLEQSFHNNQNAYSHSGGAQYTNQFYEEHKRAKEEGEDLSMVSDASSGPPHFPDDHEAYYYFNEDQENNGCYSYSTSMTVVKQAKSNGNGTKRQKVKEEMNQHHHEDPNNLPSFLHDTASSPAFDFSMDKVGVTNRQTSTGTTMLDYSQGQGFSATYFEGRSSFQEHFNFSQPSIRK